MDKSDHPIHKLARFFSPVIRKIYNLFGSVFIFIFIIIVFILTIILSIVSYQLFLVSSCLFKVIHFTLTGQSIPSISIPSSIFQFTPGEVCSISYSGSIIIFSLTIAIILLIVYTSYRLIILLRTNRLKEII